MTIRRSSTAGRRPLTWDLPGGNLEFGEELKDSILREIEEETGIEVEKLLHLILKSGVDLISQQCKDMPCPNPFKKK